MATLIKTDGSEQVVYPSSTLGFWLQELYDLIGNGCDVVKTIELADGRIMILDEESKLRDRVIAINEKATKLLAEAGSIPGDQVVGNVVIASPIELQSGD